MICTEFASTLFLVFDGKTTLESQFTSGISGQSTELRRLSNGDIEEVTLRSLIFTNGIKTCSQIDTIMSCRESCIVKPH
jgi:hypothetical protein